MLIRQRTEELERRQLSPYAALSSRSKGRFETEEECPVRTAFQRDRDRIIHSKSFRRLKHKTQVFISPEGDHYRTRLTHTLEVSQIARTIAKALRLNEDLTEAIALGHDLGHTPFGHSGEEALSEVFQGGFKHNEQSLRVVDYLDDGGMNLTWEVRDGILNHTGPMKPATLEGQIVKIADRIAYLNHDIDDALRGGILKTEDFPDDVIDNLGGSHRERINTMVIDMIKTSWDKPEITMSEPVWQSMNNLRDFLFEKVYIGSEAKAEEIKAKNLVKAIYNYFLEHPNEIPKEFRDKLSREGAPRVILDYVAGMTDRYAITRYQQLFVPGAWSAS